MTRKKMTPREMATVLAALRRFQDEMHTFAMEVGDPMVEMSQAMPGHFEDHAPLSISEIDALCERLNLGEIEL